jgi:hypothetical protein
MDMLQGEQSEVGVAASGRGGCCQRRTSLLRRVARVAARGWGRKRCCQRRTALLQSAAGVAARGTAGVATRGWRRTRAACCGRPCYKGLPDLLQGVARVAARGWRRCSHGTTACSHGTAARQGRRCCRRRCCELQQEVQLALAGGATSGRARVLSSVSGKVASWRDSPEL